MAADLGPARALRGTLVRLDPLQDSDLDELAPRLGRAEVFAGGFGGGPAASGATPDGFADFCRDYLPWAQRPFCVRLLVGPDAGAAVGTTSLYGIDPATESLFLGYTAYTPAVWGTAVNPECKRLLLADAFGHGFGRVSLRADARNDRSRAAILKLGATLEGTLRRDARRADGTWRDALAFSILAEEFPAIDAALAARIAAQSDPIAL